MLPSREVITGVTSGQVMLTLTLQEAKRKESSPTTYGERARRTRLDPAKDHYGMTEEGGFRGRLYGMTI